MNDSAQPQASDTASSRRGLRAEGWTWLAFGCYLAGVVLRVLFILSWNNANHPDRIFSDMKAYHISAQRFCDPAYVPDITDTIYPPGGGIYFGLLMKLDAELHAAVRIQCVLACLVPLLLMGIGRRLFGPRVGLFALGVSSLYFPLFEYFGYLLTEGPFTLFLLLSFYLLCVSLTAKKAWAAWVAGGGAGLMLGVAGSFKSVALSSALLVFVALLLMRRKARFRLLPTMLASAAGLVLVLVPLSMRATRLNEGRFLLIANEAHRSFLLGHHGRVRWAGWTDGRRNYHHEFGCPVAYQKGYQDVLSLDVGVYEGEKQYRMAWDWMAEHPLEAFLQSVEHSFDLFNMYAVWPGMAMPYVTWVYLFGEIYLVLLVIPAGVHLWRRRAGLFRFQPAFWGDWMALLPLVSVIAVAFLFIGEPRYRIPYDGFMILLAARAYCGVRADDPVFLGAAGAPAGAALG
ncbi:MAG: glycosyltransferase family 39 protein [Planctomycetota bacterium]|nr:glycosyltransferase family 39 protein [Planctomycetota bacterium]